MKQKIILASESSARKNLLQQAGVHFKCVAARIDEDAIKNSLHSEGAKPNEIVDTLAEYKALRVANNFPNDIVIGSDQILVCNSIILSKVRTFDEAKKTLNFLKGKSHQLLSAAVIYENNKPVWRTVSRAQLFMRDFSDSYLDEYINTSNENILSSVGCYQAEKLGPQIIKSINGDFFNVLGFPLFPFLTFLAKRQR